MWHAAILMVAASLATALPVVLGQNGELRQEDGRVVASFAGSQIIGRAEACSLHLQEVQTPNANYLSRLHSALTFANGAWSVVDLGSTNGTFVNGKKLTPWVTAPLRDGDRLGLADVTLVFRTASEPAPQAVRFDPSGARKGCEGGSAAACAVLAVAHREGIGVAKDSARAQGLFEQACTAGYEPACRTNRLR